MNQDDAGFTLLETIVMLVVVGLLVAGLAEGTRTGLATFSAETRRSHDGDDTVSTARVLRQLIVEMDPGDPTAPLPVKGRHHTLAFATDLPARPPGSTTSEALVALAVAHHDLVLRWTPRIPAPLHSPSAREDRLASGVDAADFSYWRDGAWSDHWTGDGVPGLVRLHLVPEGSATAMPDIVAAPFRAAFRSGAR